MVTPNKKVLEARLSEALKDLEEYPNDWAYLELVGRISRCLGDPEASKYFHKAVAHRPLHPSGEKDPDYNMRVGNLCRLGGDVEGALRYFQRAREIYAEQIQEKSTWKSPDPSMEIEHMIPASFLVRNDEEVAGLIERLRVLEPDITLAAYSVAKLSAARRSGDVKLAQEAVDEFTKTIKRWRAHIWDIGMISPWDWYEIAVAVLQELSGQEEVQQH